MTPNGPGKSWVGELTQPHFLTGHIMSVMPVMPFVVV
eukprot:CAMPEP_0182544636 /NCGR_PEP_ID=MMETSP1323-20130603/33426_1 /TAXON_ID=236787 /ORGANISM="Florenciella parvula, Strain RCC1693" /LENGTH=36 /DNA_ID= /DNA_START= /DNA_END= /DNA_ORIENTATION=